jgi:coenzyme F420-reducing hydrogenase delta subunit
VKCQKVIEETWEILRLLGVNERRLRLKWISASEGAAFAEEIRSFTQLLNELEDNPLAENRDKRSDLNQMAGA